MFDIVRKAMTPRQLWAQLLLSAGVLLLPPLTVAAAVVVMLRATDVAPVEHAVAEQSTPAVPTVPGEGAAPPSAAMTPTPADAPADAPVAKPFHFSMATAHQDAVTKDETRLPSAPQPTPRDGDRAGAAAAASPVPSAVPAPPPVQIKSISPIGSHDPSPEPLARPAAPSSVTAGAHESAGSGSVGARSIGAGSIGTDPVFADPVFAAVPPVAAEPDPRASRLHRRAGRGQSRDEAHPAQRTTKPKESFWLRDFLDHLNGRQRGRDKG